MDTANRRTDGTGHPVFRLKSALLGFVVVVVAFASLPARSLDGAIGGPVVEVTPTGIRQVGFSLTGIDTRATFTANLNGKTSFFTKHVPVSAGTLGKLAKGAVRRGLGWYAAAEALKGVIDGAGWAIDELGKQVLDGVPRDQENAPAGTKMAVITWNGEKLYAANPANLEALFTAQLQRSAPGLTINCVFSQWNGGFARFWCGDDIGFQNLGSEIVPQPTPNYGTGYEPQELSDNDLGQALKQSALASSQLLTDPVTGAVVMFPEMVDAVNSLRQEIEAANGLASDPTRDVVVDPTYGEETRTNEEGEMPAFCDWADIVCDFVTWFKADNDDVRELPETQVDVPTDSWVSGVGGGSCPAPETFSIEVVGQSASGEFSWDPVCSFATTIQPFFIAACGVLGAVILAGLRTGGK